MKFITHALLLSILCESSLDIMSEQREASKPEFGCAHAISKPAPCKLEFEVFQPSGTFLANVASVEQTTKQLFNGTRFPTRKTNGQVKNYWTEKTFLELHAPKANDIVYYTGAAPGHHLQDLAHHFRQCIFMVGDNNPAVFNENRSLFQMPNVHLVREPPDRPRFHIDDNLPRDAPPAIGDHNLFKWVPLAVKQNFRAGASVIYPPCAGQACEELKQTFPAGSTITENPPANYQTVFATLNRWRCLLMTGYCRDCHYADKCHTNRMRAAKDAAGFSVPWYSGSEPSYREMLAGSTSFRKTQVEGRAHHPEIKMARDIVRTFIHGSLAGKKVVEAGPRTSHVMGGAREQVGWHYCHPMAHAHDVDFMPPLSGLNTKCACKIEECKCHKAEYAVLQDVYLSAPQVTQLLKNGVKRIYWAFNNLPSGDHRHLNIRVSRQGGRLRVFPYDAGDKQYDDPDPLHVLQDFDYRVVYNNGLYLLVELGEGVDSSFLPPNTGGVLRHVQNEDTTFSVVPNNLVAAVYSKISDREVDRTGDAISRMVAQLDVKDPELGKTAVIAALQDIATTTKQTTTSIVKLIGEIKAGKRVTQGPGATFLSFFSEVSEGSSHPFFAALKSVGVALLDTAKGMIDSFRGWLVKWAEWFRSPKRKDSLFYNIYKLIARMLEYLVEWIDYFRAAPAQCVEPVPFPSRPDFEFPDIVSNIHIPPETSKSLKTSPLDYAYPYAPPPVDVPPPSIIDRASVDTTLGCVQKRLGNLAGSVDIDPEAMALMESNLTDVFDEVTGGELIEPQDFQSGWTATPEPIQPGKSSDLKGRTKKSAPLSSISKSFRKWMRSSKGSSSSRANAHTSSDQETCTTELSSDPTSPPSRADSDNIPKPVVLEPTGPELPPLSSSSEISPISSKPTTPHGICTSPPPSSRRSIASTPASSRSHRRIKTILRQSSARISR